ncbi:DUF6543 domain-containing protein [Pseudomonas sp. A34-9]|uniref:dermonecrotic toxin domain-containing protein n=1 Tax=Pseudomonas sp. A34-9 TaxID=3034675 RepID=UPI00240E29DF|nr:DUF6543 domain-containing protein [Pseudomonas sp. A34-9]
MHLSEGQLPAVATDITVAQHPDSHYETLKDALPAWLGNVSSTRRQALKDSRPALPVKLQNASSTEHQTLKSLNAAHLTAQSEVDKQFEHLQDASAFAEPLLKTALKSRFDLDLDVRTTFLRLYIPATTALFPIKTGARTWTVSLLDAALHNFDEDEIKDNAFESESSFITQPSASGQFDTLPAIKSKLSIAAFTRLCRELDIGKQYNTYLESNLGISDPAVAAPLRLKIDKSQKAAIRAALQMAQMNRDISASHFRLVNALLDGFTNIRSEGYAWICHDLTMMSAPLTGILVFIPDPEKARKVKHVVAYVPDDPDHPIKEYASTAEMAVELTRQLRSKDYQQFFSRFVNHEQRGFFFASLNERLSQIKWHPPVAGSSEPTWRETPVDKPDLQFDVTAIKGDLWEHLYQARLNKILNDARTLAVPTAVVDQKKRWAFWDSLISIASSILQTAAFVIAPFVPVLGEAMMAYMAYQFLDEAFEGIIEWAQGRTKEAFEHLMGTLESLIQLGAFAIGGNIAAAELPKILPKEIMAFINRFKSVKMADGKTRYWDPDLARYQQESLPGADSKPNQLGLHEHQGKLLLPLDDAHFAVKESATPGQYLIEHPTRPDAYQPLVRHNGDGAWHTEFEQPLEWDTPTALRRIGPSVESFTPAERETIRQVSGVSEDTLRKMHADQDSVPPLLADSIQRFKLDQQLQRFVNALSSEVPEDYLRADPVMQLQLLTEHGRWPTGERLRLIDQQGDLVWQSSSDEALPLTEIHSNGNLLKTLLQALDETRIKTLLGEEFAGPTPSLEVRSQTLRKQLAQLAGQHRASMFEARYQALQVSKEPLAQPIVQHDPTLPASITRELLDTATGDELLAMSEGQLPARQQQLMQLASQEVRVTRAYEGLELDSVNNPDSDTLALHSLQQLPGWSGDVRIEIRDGRYEGPMLASTGRAHAPAQKILVRQADGRYQPYDDRGQQLHSVTDFYTGILYALPDAERQKLNIQIGQGATLKAAIRKQPMPRNELRVAIAHPPNPEPKVDTLRLLGRRSTPTQAREIIDQDNFFEVDEAGIIIQDNLFTQGEPPITPEQRVQAILRGYSLEEARAFVARFPNDPAGFNAELVRLRNEFLQLTEYLRHWETDVPAYDPFNGLPLSDIQRNAAVRNRELFASAIESCWRRQTDSRLGPILQIAQPILGDLPVLDADFSHVTILSLNGNRSTTGFEAFLQRLPGLQTFGAQNLNLPQLPQALTSMPSLRQLILRDCGVTLSPANQSVLASLRELDLLDLRNNPLGAAPDLNAMPALREINLNDTEITSVPLDLLDHPRLIKGSFEGNQISEVPAAFFDLANALSDGFNFARNPLSAASREQVKLFYGRTGKHLGVVPELADITRTTALYPALNADQAVDLLYRLPGTLVEGRAQLSAWETEISRLSDDLDQWSANIPAQNPLTDLPFTAQQVLDEGVARKEFATRLKQFWRNRSPNQPSIRDSHFMAAPSFIGDMPVLSADFSHVSRLTLTGIRTVSGMQRFLQRFANVNILELRHFDLPAGLLPALEMPRLNTLELKNCGLVMTPENQAALIAMNRLQFLELSDNLLTTFPDVKLLPELTYLDLSNNGISVAPDSLAEHPKLQTAILSANLISEIPTGVFELPANRGDGIDFANNPLSPESREQIKAYYRKTGYDFGVPADAADVNLARELFPGLDQQDASDIIYDLGGTLADGRARLQGWRAELERMTADLTAWAPQVPSVHPVTGDVLSAIELFDQYAARSDFAQRLERLWRKRSGMTGMREDFFGADLKFIGEMPRLTVDFNHLSTVILRGNPAIQNTEAFLELFPHLQMLEMHDFDLGQVPNVLTRMTDLKELTLAKCNLVLTPDGQNVLKSLSELELLDLSNNETLGMAPDLPGLPAVSDLRLSNTGLSTLPDGIVDHPQLESVELDGNHITELPESLFDPIAELVEGVNLANNPLSTAARERIKAYFVEQHIDFGVLPDPGDMAKAKELFPVLSDKAARDLIYGLPGTLEAGSAQLVAWEAELARMNSDLELWVSRVPMGSPAGGRVLDAAELVTQRSAREAFRRKLEQRWRNRISDQQGLPGITFFADLKLIGELPTLTADFSFVTQLTLLGGKALNVPDGFLGCFTGLRGLEIRSLNLGRFPRALSRMPSLQTLMLSSCDVVFDAQAQTTLTAMHRLTALNLFNNALGSVPDVSSLQELGFLNLSSTGIDRVPPGVARLPRLGTTLLADNQIAELPESLTGFSRAGVNLKGNQLSATSRERIKTYYKVTSRNLGIMAEQADIDLAQSLYPHLGKAKASDVIYRLPGTLAEGRAELLRRETELTTLLGNLESWTHEIPLDPVTGARMEAGAWAEEKSGKMQFMAQLEQCWRSFPGTADTNDFTCNLSFSAELPLISAQFAHIRKLKLTSSASASPRLDRLLDLFPHLQELQISAYPLHDLPAQVLLMPDLDTLSLPDCRIVLTRQSADALASMSGLQTLNLRGNPLGMAPNVSRLTQCRLLDLSNTELTETPEGLFELAQLQHANLSGNAIGELPAQLLSPPPGTTAYFDFAGNPLSAESEQRLVALNAANQARLAEQRRAHAVVQPDPVALEGSD